MRIKFRKTEKELKNARNKFCLNVVIISENVCFRKVKYDYYARWYVITWENGQMQFERLSLCIRENSTVRHTNTFSLE